MCGVKDGIWVPENIFQQKNILQKYLSIITTSTRYYKTSKLDVKIITI